MPRQSVVDAALRYTRERLEAADVAKEAADCVLVAVLEALGNVVRHACAAARHPDFVLSVEVHRGCAVVEVIDHGPGFTLIKRQMPGAFAEGGRGLALMQSLCDSVSYTKDRDGNHLTIRKRIATSD